MKLVALAIAAIGVLGSDAHSQSVSALLDAKTLGFTTSFRAKSLITDKDKLGLPAPVTLRSELTELFKGNGCTLPAKLIAALKQKTGVEALIPNELIDAFTGISLDTQLQKFPDKTANAVIHSVTIPLEGSNTRQLSLVGAESYKTKTAGAFLDPEASDFAFTMDCSGYLSAALRMDVNVPTSQLALASDGALKNTKSLAVMRGHVFSPAAAAMDRSLGGAGLTDRQRIDLLYAIISEVVSDGVNRGVDVPDTTSVTAWRKIDMVWTSNSGESSLNGKANLSGSGTVGAGLASVSASMGAGGAVSRQMSFNSFNTYILDAKVLEPVQRTLGVLKKALADEVSRISQGSTSTVDSAIVVEYPAMPEIPCKRKWTASTATNQAPGNVATTWSESGCKVTFTKAQGLVDKSVLALKTTAFGTELALMLTLP